MIPTQSTETPMAKINAAAEGIAVRRALSVRDSDIARAARDALDQAVEVPAGSVKVAVRDQVITLSGTTHWHFQSAAATRAVRRLAGVTAINNAIRVRPDVSAEEIMDAIESALRDEATPVSADLKVTTDNGDVLLEGTVHSWSERHHAENVAWAAPGVTHVTSNLRLEHE
jgi:osmotically-inducible protein OsmY